MDAARSISLPRVDVYRSILFGNLPGAILVCILDRMVFHGRQVHFFGTLWTESIRTRTHFFDIGCHKRRADDV